ncbi:hypothetical protein ACFL3I_00455 [Pseudomonadota bacterium]
MRNSISYQHFLIFLCVAYVAFPAELSAATCEPSLDLWCPGQSDSPSSYIDGCNVSVNGVTAVGCGSSLLWDWGDNTGIEHLAFPGKHHYTEPGTYTVRVTVEEIFETCDVQITEESCDTQINLSLSDPEYSSCGVVKVGGVFTSDDPADPIESVRFDWGDEVEYDLGFPAWHTYGDDGLYTLVVTATTTLGATKTAR